MQPQRIQMFHIFKSLKQSLNSLSIMCINRTLHQQTCRNNLYQVHGCENKHSYYYSFVTCLIPASQHPSSAQPDVRALPNHQHMAIIYASASGKLFMFSSLRGGLSCETFCQLLFPPASSQDIS